MSEMKVALVTGAGSGIGRATALRLSSDGMAVAVVDIVADAAQKVVEEIKANGGKAVAFTADVSSEKSVDEMFDAVLNEFGHIDNVAANAGIAVVTFNVASPEDAVKISFTTIPTKDPVSSKTIVRSPILNGFELNTVSIAAQAKDPYPTSGDMHIDADNGSCQLSWTAASESVSAHNLYLGTDSAQVADMTVPQHPISRLHHTLLPISLPIISTIGAWMRLMLRAM